MLPQPGHPGLFADLGKAAAQGVFADDLRHAQQAGVDPVAADRGGVCVAPVPGQDRQQPSAEQVPLGRRIGAEVGQRAILDP